MENVVLGAASFVLVCVGLGVLAMAFIHVMDNF